MANHFLFLLKMKYLLLKDPYTSFLQEWEMLSFVRSLKSVVRLSNAVAVVTFPPSLVSTTFSIRLQHLADTLVSVKAIPGVHCSFFAFSCTIPTNNACQETWLTIYASNRRGQGTG